MKTSIKKMWIALAVLCLSFSASAYDFELDGIYYNLNHDKMTAIVVKGNGIDITIPAEITSDMRKYTVTSIGYGAFNGCTSLESITIPNSVTSIGAQAFVGCKSLKTIKLSNSLTLIDRVAFWGCTSLESITIPDSVTFIGAWAFQECSSLKTIKLPNSLTSIEIETFRDCRSLESITIPDSVTYIEMWAFQGCKSLDSVNLSTNLKEIKDYAFFLCESLTSIEIPGSVIEISQDAFLKCPISSLKLTYGPEKLQHGIWMYDNYEHGIDFWPCEWEEWYTINELYIDRQLENYIKVPNVKKLVIGEHLDEVPVIFSRTSQTIECHAITPPAWAHISVGDPNNFYKRATVYVPEEALETYKADPVWGKFWNLLPLKNLSGITTLYDNSEKIGRAHV